MSHNVRTLSSESRPDPDTPDEVLLAKPVQWPSRVQRYNARWPAPPQERPSGRNSTIVIASQEGTGAFDTATQLDLDFYVQNDSSKPGFNPNQEHALKSGNAIFALRSDLNVVGHEPYVLVRFRQSSDDDPDAVLWTYEAYKVEEESADATFNFARKVGQLVEPILPIVTYSPKYEENGPVGALDQGKVFEQVGTDQDGKPIPKVVRTFKRIK